MNRRLARLARMRPDEIAWRVHASARIHVDRWRIRARGARWQRRMLAPRLERHVLAPARAALRGERWFDAHEALTRHFATRPSRFVVAHASRASVVGAVRRTWPGAAGDAVERADRLLAGQYDVLGFRGLQFGANGQLPDWHLDPVHDRRAPQTFWSTVPYLDPACGDHKIIWELNRHQHWLVLGRAYWLTGRRAYRDRVIAELASWLAANPPLVGINWSSMLELSFRAISWLWTLEFLVDDDGDDRTPWLVDLLLALDVQLSHVERNLSRYFSPNTHLLGEALALYVCGRVLPELSASARRTELGRKVLFAEASRQIVEDGGHCERSTHYQRYALDFFLLALAIARITDDPIAETFEKSAVRLAMAARLLADDNGRFPRIGDDDGGKLLVLTARPHDDIRDTLALAAALTARPDLSIGAPPEEAAWMLSHPKLRPSLDMSTRNAGPRETVGSAALPATGYFVSRGDSHHLVIDGGPHGYLNGGHAHADALSMTLTIDGLPLLIDPGTGSYTVDPQLRDRLRSTASHNTLELDGRPQSTPAGPFHWQRTAEAHVHRWRTAAGLDYFDGSHAGYEPVEHRRRVVSLHGWAIVVADFVSGPGRHRAAVHWHLHPRWRWSADGFSTRVDAAAVEIGFATAGGCLERFIGDDEPAVGWWSPVYGQVEPATTIRITHEGAAPFWIVSVFDLDPLDPVHGVDLLPVWSEAGSLAHGTAVRIAREHSTDYALFAEPAQTTPGTGWRAAELETDACMLVARVGPSASVLRLALADGSFVRYGQRAEHQLRLPDAVPALRIDRTLAKDPVTCAASPVS